MNKRKIITTIILFVIGFGVIAGINFIPTLSEETTSVMSGFAGGILGVAFYRLYTIIRFGKDKNYKEEAKRIQYDERLIAINDKSLALTLKVLVLTLFIAYLVLLFLDMPTYYMIIGYILCALVVIASVISFILSKKY